jgi:putative phage-type endonuclease
MGVHPKPPHGSLEWLQLRHRDARGRVRFGASEAPTLMGVNPYASVTDLAIAKWSPPEVSAPNAAMERGNILEPALVAYAEQVLGQPVTTPEVMWSVGRMMATLDGITADERTIVEAKTTTAYSSDDPLPDSYYWQGIAQLACVPEADRVLFVVLDKRMRLGTWELRRDDVRIAMLLARADEIGEMLDARQLPDDAPLTESQVKSLYPSPTGTLELPPRAVELAHALNAAKTARQMFEADEQQVRDELAAMLGDADTGTVAGEVVVTFRARKGSTRLDTKRLEAEHPDLAAAYQVTGSTTRVLRVEIS